MNIKVLLLDIDGVLIDDTKIFYDSIHQHYDLSKEDFMEFYNSIYKKAWVCDKIDLKESLKIWLDKWQINDSPDNFLKNWFKTEDRPNLELINFIKDLDNIFLVTTQEKYRLKYILEEMNFNEFTREAFASYMFETRKPEIDFYEKVFSQLLKYYPNLNPEEVLFFDDLNWNVEGAKKFGFKSYKYENFEKFKEIINKFI